MRHKEMSLQLALEVLVLSEPGLDVLAVALEPVDLGTDGVETLLNSTVVALKEDMLAIMISEMQRKRRDVFVEHAEGKSLTLVSLAAKNSWTSLS
jgi:hypothetical protein